MSSVESFSWLEWVIPTIASVIMGTLLFVSKGSFRKGRVEASVAGRMELTNNMVTNTIGELERIRRDIDKLTEGLQNQDKANAILNEKLRTVTNSMLKIQDQIEIILYGDHVPKGYRWVSSANRKVNDDNNGETK